MNSRRINLWDQRKRQASAVIAGVVLGLSASITQADIAATHIYHNHMPNFWPYYDVAQYDSLPVGAPIRYMYDGQVKQLKANPPPNYSFFIPGSGAPRPMRAIPRWIQAASATGSAMT